MAKYIIESYKEFRNQYLKIQGDIDNLKTQIDVLKISRKELLVNSRKEFVAMFKDLEKKSHVRWHKDFDEMEVFIYDLDFKVKNKRQALELIEELTLTLEDFSTQNSHARLEVSLSISNSKRYTSSINTDESRIYNRKDWDQVTDFHVRLILVEDVVPNGGFKGKSPIEIISFLNKLEDAIEKNETLDISNPEEAEDEPDDYEEEEEEEDEYDEDEDFWEDEE